MSSTPVATPPADFVRPDEIRALGGLLRRSGAEFESEIRGGSMGETLPAGSRIRIRCEQGTTSETGDIIAFVTGTGLVAHRVVHRGRLGAARRYLLTRGDASVFADPPVEIAAVIGRVVACRQGDQWIQPQQPSRSLARRMLGALALGLEAGALNIHPALPRWIGARVAGLKTLRGGPG